AQREVGAAPFVQVYPRIEAFVPADHQGKRRRAGPRTQANVSDPGLDKPIDEGAHVVAKDLSRPRRYSLFSAHAIVSSLILVSSYSRAGSDPATMPLPPYSLTFLPWTRPDLIATAKSPFPAPSIHPTGPAYQPRSRLSYFSMSARAFSRG